MEREKPTHFVVGPPAAGKSTIACAVASQLGLTFRSLDDWTPRGQPVSDDQIQEALERLFESTKGVNDIAEFCHHDYNGLLDANRYPIFTGARKIVITAPLDICKARNRVRRSPVREMYVERAWLSTESLVRRWSTAEPGRIIVVDTSSQSVDAAVSAVIRFLLADEGGERHGNPRKQPSL